MVKLDSVACVVLSTPIVECEQPFYMTFDVKVQGDVVPAFFLGEYARQLQHNIRPGDKGVIREALVDNGKLAFTFMHLEPACALGRNVDLMC